MPSCFIIKKAQDHSKIDYFTSLNPVSHVDKSSLFNQYFVLVLLNGGTSLCAMPEAVASETNRPAGRHWRHVCWQASVKTQPAGSYTAVPYLLKHSQSTMNGGLFSLSPPLCMSRETSLRVLPGPTFIASWPQWGLSKITGVLIALGYFVWAGGLTHPESHSKRCFHQGQMCFRSKH